MGYISHYRIAVLVVILALTAVVVQLKPESRAANKEVPLEKAFGEVDGWQSHGQIPMDARVVRALDLDDYLNQYYVKAGNRVGLYVGYYLTKRKVGAAHSPLVCFPGQGWSLSDQEKRVIAAGNHEIQATSMVISRGVTRELVLYWFQAGNRTFAGTFLQKLCSLWNSLVHGRGDNAFIRVSVPVENASVEEAFDKARDFIEVFYPRFLSYVNQDQTR